jgi:sialic acid synthase SpsE
MLFILKIMIMIMTYVVAEIGVNWNGDFNLVEEMIKNAKNSGCNAVKFQSFNEDIVKDHPEKSCLLQSSISSSNIEIIDSISKKIGIEWFCTPMYLESVDLLEPFVDKYKIREIDARSILNNKITPLIQKIFDTKKEIIASSEIPIDTIILNNYKNIKWLYCVPKYPCKLSDVNFKSIQKFYGYSNHCPNIVAPLSAHILGCEIIEIHITSDKNKSFFDNNVSFDYTELNNLMKMMHQFDEIQN